LLARDPVVLRIVHHSTTEIISNFYSHWSLASRTARLCRLFLLDRHAIAAIHHDFQIRYSSFLWLEKFCAKRQRRTVLPLLLGAADISRGFEVRIWKKEPCAAFCGGMVAPVVKSSCSGLVIENSERAGKSAGRDMRVLP
jgi:hypothetical protein